MATDWAKLKLTYVNGTMTMRQLAARNKINSAGLMKRAAKEGWEAERKRRSAEVSRAAQSTITERRIEELEVFNEEDLKLARTLRERIEEKAGADDLSAQDLRALAGAHEAAQRVGRLALGAATDSSELTGKDGKPLFGTDAKELTDEQLAHIAATSGA